MDQFEENVFIEGHYYDGGFKTKFISDLPRPKWLPNPELLGVDNTIDLPKDGIVIEISRHKSDSRLVTWIGAFVNSDDLVYGARSNYVGVGVWLGGYLAISTDKIINALIKITWLIKRDGHAAALGPGKALLTDAGYLRSWTRQIQDLPDISKGLVFDNTGFPKSSYIDAGVGNIDGAIQRVATSLLTNQFSLDKSFQDSSRLVYIATQGDRSNDVSKMGFKDLVESNSTAQIFAYFSESVNALKADVGRAYLDREDALTKLSQEEARHADTFNELEAIRNESVRLNASVISIQTRQEHFKEQLRAISSKITLAETAQAILDLSSIFDDEVDRINLKRAMERLLSNQIRPTPSLVESTPANVSKIALENEKTGDLRVIKEGITRISAELALLSVSRNPLKSGGDESKMLRSALSSLPALKNDMAWYLRILYPTGILILSILIVGSSIFIYYDLGDRITKLNNSIGIIGKSGNKRSDLQSTYPSRSSDAPMNQSVQTAPSDTDEPVVDSPSLQGEAPQADVTKPLTIKKNK